MAWDLFENFKRMQDEMDKLFRKQLAEFSNLNKSFSRLSSKMPVTSTIEKDDKLIINFELPGVDKKDVFVNVNDTFIEVRAEKKSEARKSKKGFKSYKSSYRGYYTKLPLSGVKADSAKATYKNGLLVVEIPKLKAKSKKTKKILVK